MLDLKAFDVVSCAWWILETEMTMHMSSVAHVQTLPPASKQDICRETKENHYIFDQPLVFFLNMTHMYNDMYRDMTLL